MSAQIYTRLTDIVKAADDLVLEIKRVRQLNFGERAPLLGMHLEESLAEGEKLRSRLHAITDGYFIEHTKPTA